jgi:hypothetical protein
MALNLWKTGGKPTSYSPLPTGNGNSVSIGLGDYVISFRAKSASGGTIQIFDNGFANVNQSYVLTSNYQSISLTFNRKVSNANSLFLQDKNNNGDIIIDSIQLVQKPLPKLTINGVDGFQSGKWTLHANAQVVDDETLVLNATANGQSSLLEIPFTSNTQFTVSALSITPSMDVNVYSYNASNVSTYLGSLGSNTLSKTLISSSDSVKLRISTYNNASGTFTFTKPMLNLGSIPAPYSKKTGDKMVMPTAKKNLIPTDISQWVVGSVNGSGGDTVDTVTLRSAYIPVKPNTTYMMNVTSGYQHYIHQYDVNKTGIVSGSWQTGSKQITTNVNTSFIRVLVENTPNVVITTSQVANAQPQLEQNTVATAYESYNVQVNKKPQKYLPKKNLFDGQFEQGSIGSADGSNVATTDRIRVKNYISVLPNTQYTISNNKGYVNPSIYYYDINKNFISYAVGNNVYTTPSNCYFVRFIYVSTGSDITTQAQIEQGSTATPYEPYQLILPPSKKGLSFNGITDYLQLPSMTMDAIEIDCLIDPTTPAGSYLIDARSGLANGFVWTGGIGVGWSSVKINSVIKSTWADIAKNERVKILFNTVSQFTDNVNIFSGNAGTAFLKGILYKVTCYLAGNVVAQYDFENSKNIVGNQIIPNSQNLIPSFEDARWSIHANAKVMGKDVLHLDATATYQSSYVTLTLKPNTTYLVKCDGYGRLYFQDKFDSTYLINNQPIGSSYTITTKSTTTDIMYYVSNGALTTNSFDFIKPQLYQLSGKEGTIYGSPVQQNKGSKRSKYSIR